VDIAFRIPETSGPEIVVRRPFVGFMSVLVDGVKARRISRRGLIYRIPMPDGSTTDIELVGQWRGLRARVAGTEFPIERSLTRWEIVLTFLPLALFAVGGWLIGGLIAAVAVAVNARIVRKLSTVPLRIMSTLAVTGLATATVIGIGFAIAPLPTLAVGTCLNGIHEGVEVSIKTARPVDCAGAHENEVIGTTRDAAGGSFPGMDALVAEAQTPCSVAFGSYVGSDYESSDLVLMIVVPSELTWARGDRAIACVALAADGSKLIGSIKGSRR
jgi:hypothetical protein